MENLEKAANKWLKPYPNAGYRENGEVLLVALTVAMGIRTFFLQPFKIPTGSMQPTLYGVTSVPDYGQGFDEAAAQANAAIGILGPIATTLLAVAILGEPLTAIGMAGTALVLAGVGWFTLAERE